MSGYGQTISVFPFYDDLETWSLCSENCTIACVISSDWSNQGTADFRPDTAGTPTGATGPSVDFNPGLSSGVYAYVESSAPCNPDTALLESPYIDLTAVVGPEFAFRHHQQSAISIADTFEVLVSTDSGTSWSVGFTGPNTTSANLWVADTMDLTPWLGNIIKLQIRFVTANSFNDFAVDDFAFLGIQEIDAGVDSVFSSNGFCMGDSSSLCVNLVNEGLVPIDSVTIYSSLNGGALFSPFIWENTLPAGEDTIVCIGNVLLSQGDSIAFYTDMPNGENDTFNLNDTASLTVFLNALPTVNAGIDTTACALDSFQLGGSPTSATATSFLWSNTGFLNDSTIANPVAYFTASGSYEFVVEVQDANLCFNEDTIEVTIFPLTSVSAGLDSARCINDSVILGANPTAPPTAALTWSPAAFLSNPTAQNPKAAPPVTTDFSVTAIDLNGCDFSDTVRVIIFDLPSLDAGPDTSVCIGSSVQIGGAPTALNFDSILWTPTASLNDSLSPNPIASPTTNTEYFVDLIDTHGCVFRDSIEVLVVSLPSANAGSDTTVCAFEPFQVGGSPTGPLSATYIWSPAGLFNDPTLANPLVTVLQDTQLVVSVTDTITGCSSTDTVLIQTLPLPLVDVGVANIQICKGDTLSIGGNPTTTAGNTIVWSPGIDLDDSTAFNPLLTADSSYTIIATVSEPVNGCTNIDSIQVIVNPLPIVNAGNGDTICVGDTTVLGGNPTSNLLATYNWSMGTTLNDSTSANPSATPNQSTLYQLQVSTTNGCLGFDSVFIRVDTLPVPVVNPIPLECLNEPVQLSVGGGTTYLWNNPQFLNDSSIANPIATPPGNTVFIVTVTDANGCFDTASLNVLFDTLPVVDAGEDSTICYGNTAQLFASGANNYVWSPSGSLNNANVDSPLASPLMSTVYTVTGTDNNGCTGTDSATVVVNSLPITDAGPDVIVCQNDSVSIGGSPTGPAGSTYTWNNNNLNNVSIANPMFISGTLAVGNYNVQVEVIDVNGCVNTDALVVTVLDAPDAQINPIVNTICIGDTINISATGGVQYQWSPTATLTTPNAQQTGAFPSTTTTYTVTVTDANGCSANTSDDVNVFPLTQANAGVDVEICQQESIQLSASGGVMYQWSNPFVMDGENTATPTAYPISTTTFTVTVTDVNGCSETDDVVVRVNPLPIAAGGPDGRICLGESFEIGGNPTGPPGSEYIWSPGSSLDDNTTSNPIATPSKTTIYRVTVTSPKGCQDSADAIVQVDSIPTIELLTDLEPICRNDSMLIAITDGYNTYQWSPDVNISDVRSDSVVVYPKQDKTYSVTVTNGRGCSATKSFELEVKPLPVVSGSEDSEICEGDSVQVEAFGGVLYAWSDGSTLSDSLSQLTIARPTETTNYSVTVTDTNNCKNTAQVLVEVFEKPFVDAGETIANCDIDVVQLGGTPSGPADAVYTWEPSTGLDDPFSPNPMVLNPEATTYYLEVQNKFGCFAEDSVFVNADCFSLVYAPSAFTPGNNKLNDEFKLVHYRVNEPTLTIFNRWGNVVFETKDLDKAWDGKFQGRELPSDTYYWFLSYKTIDLKKASKEGTVSILR
ncbi:MAG: hypothetical protein Salg2KO_15650 [Salibacteraceae bacterium]